MQGKNLIEDESSKINNQQRELTNLGLPEMPFGTSGVKFLRTPSNIEGLDGRAISKTVESFFIKLELPDTSKSDMNSAKAVKVG